MNRGDLFAAIAALPKAELHLHLEGSIEPGTAVALAARHGVSITEAEVLKRYRCGDFAGFLDAYKWITSFLRTPEDYALITRALAEYLMSENVVYAEVTVSAGVMLLREHDLVANFAAIRAAAAPYAARGLRLQWIFDAVRQFGPAPAMSVARCAAELRGEGVVAFGLGGDELAVPAADFRDVYDFAASRGLHRLAHAGEIGGPQPVREAIKFLGVERIGHGIGAALDPALLAELAERGIHLEICPTSNLRTGALARQFGPHLNTGAASTLADHPLPRLLRAGVPLSVSTDDPAMFEISLNREYENLAVMGLSEAEMLRVAEGGFAAAFLSSGEKAALIENFRAKAESLGLKFARKGIIPA